MTPNANASSGAITLELGVADHLHSINGNDFLSPLSASPSTAELTWKIFQNLGDDLLDHFPIDLVMNAKHSFNYDTQGYIQRRLRAALRPWFDEPRDLLDAMESTKAVISGSFVLRFVLGTAEWRPRNLDLYVRTGTLSSRLKNAIATRGFTLTRVIENPRFDPQLSDVRRISLYKKEHPEKSTVYVDVIETPGRHAFAPVFRFHLTCLMNFMTHQGIYILYPALTLSLRAIVHPRENRSDEVLEQPQFTKWSERGFKILRSVEELRSDCGNACQGLWRSVADIGCLVCLFRDGGTDILSLTSEMEDMTWTLTVDGDMPISTCPNPNCLRTPLMYPRRDGILPVTPFSDDDAPADINNMNIQYTS